MVFVAVGLAGLFVVDVESTDPEPVRFEETVSMGLSDADVLALERDVVLPRVQVFYSQYRYVVGYYGVETFVEDRRQAGHEQRFGYPLTVYVSDYSPLEFDLDEDGYPTSDRLTGWVDVEHAYFVVGSDARTPAGETVLPFSERADAERFSEDHGGSVLTWEELLATEFEVDTAETVRDRVADQDVAADRLVEDAAFLHSRPTSQVVGDDAETIQEAIDAAEENTTVVVPAGTYEEAIEIDDSITLRAEGNTTIEGDGNGTVVTITAPDVALSGFEVTGAGAQLRDPDADIEEDTWDHNVELGYGHGDAGIAAVDAPGVLIENVTIETPSNGVLLRDSPDAVVRDATIYGTEEWDEGFMAVMSMRSPGVIEESTFVGGRDGVYTHRSDGIVIRDNEMRDGRFGVHLMHTSETLIADNRVRGQDLAGIIIMTGPEGNAVVGNDVRDSTDGIRTSGSDVYLAENVLLDNAIGFTTAADNSIYEDNLVAGNDVGVRASSVVPTNRVVDNAFVDNHVHAEATTGPLFIFTHDGTGNYWEGAIGTSDGVTLDRSYSPTAPIDAALHRTDGTPTLARAPALDAIAAFEATVPGMRAGSITDLAPLCEPPHPERFDETGYDPAEYACGGPAIGGEATTDRPVVDERSSVSDRSTTDDRPETDERTTVNERTTAEEPEATTP